jgi:hypothetical protein
MCRGSQESLAKAAVQKICAGGSAGGRANSPIGQLYFGGWNDGPQSTRRRERVALNMINDELKASGGVPAFDLLVIAVTSAVDLVECCAKLLEILHGPIALIRWLGCLLTHSFVYLIAELDNNLIRVMLSFSSIGNEC